MIGPAASGVLGYEFRNLSEDRVFGGLLLRVYPFDWLAIDAGAGARDALDDFGAGSFDVPWGIEYAPAPLRDLGLSLFLQDGLQDGTRVVGLRWTVGGARRSLVARDRSAGPLRVRP